MCGIAAQQSFNDKALAAVDLPRPCYRSVIGRLSRTSFPATTNRPRFVASDQSP